MNTALIYLPVTIALGIGLATTGSRGWISCAAIVVGLLIMCFIDRAAHPWLTAFVVWSAVAAVLTFMTPAPLLACAFCAASAASYLYAMTGGDGLVTVWISNIFGVAMLLSLFAGGIIEYVGNSDLVLGRRSPGDFLAGALRERDHPAMAP